MSCVIDKGIGFVCGEIPQPGIKAEVIRINFEDYLQAKRDALITVDPVSGEITALSLPTGKQGYLIQVPTDANIVPDCVNRRTTGVSGFDHSTNIIAATMQKIDYDNLAKGQFNKVVDIVTLLDGRSQVYGGNVGLRMLEFRATPSDADLGATVTFLSKTDDKGAPEIAPVDFIAVGVDLAPLLLPGV